MKPTYHFFWSGIASQWFSSRFTEFGETFWTAEQFMMAAKAKLFNDEEIFEQIMATKDPKQQKALGRKVRGFDSEAWDAVAREYVTLGNYNKFLQDDRCLIYLVHHRNEYFVEASPYDKVWGIGMREGDPGIEDPSNWKGSNWLGQCINAARDLIISEDEFELVEDLRVKLDWRK